MMKRATNRAVIKAPPAPKVRAADSSPGVTIDGLQNLVAGLGTGRDKMSYSTYERPLVLERQQLENMFRSSWLARKVVSAPAEDMTREWRSFQFDEDEVQEDNQFALEEGEREHAVRDKFRQALMWARLYGGAALLLGVGSPNDYEKPLDPKKVRKGDLKFVRALDRWTCIADGQMDWDLSSPNFGRPKFYRIGTLNGPRVHHSRVIRLEGAPLPYMAAIEQNSWGDSILQAGYDALLGRDTLTAGISTMVFEANVDVMSVADLTELLSTKEGEAKVTKRFQLAALMKSFNRMLIIGEGETYEKKQNSFAGLPDLVREYRAEVAGAFSIPVSRLFGTSASGLNATGDNEVRSYYDDLSGQQNAGLRTALECFDEVFVRSTLGTMPDDYRFTFKPLWQLSAAEKAVAEKTRAERDAIYLDKAVITEGVAAKQLKEDGTYPVLTEEDVDAAVALSEELEQQAAEQPSNEEIAAAAIAAGTPGAQIPAQPGIPQQPDDTAKA